MSRLKNPSLRKNGLAALRILVTAGLLYWVLRSAGIGQVLGALGSANAWLLALAILFLHAGVAVRTLRWWTLLRGSGVTARFGSLLGLAYVGQFFSTALPTGFAGDVVRAVEFKEGDSTAMSAGVVMLDRMLGLATMFAIVLVALAIGYTLLPPLTALILAAVALAGLMGLVVVLQGSLLRRVSRFLPPALSLSGEGWPARLYKAVTGCSFQSVLQALGLSVVNSLLTILIDFVVARALGITLGVGLFFVFAPIITLGLLLPSIGGLGLREVGYQLFLTPLGIPASLAVALGLDLYLIRLTSALFGGLYYLLWSSRRLASSE